MTLKKKRVYNDSREKAVKQMDENVDFYKRAGIVCRQIPEGRVASYGQIALLCGFPHNARQVGYALRTGRLGEVPAHRVVNAQGRMSGAAAFEVWDMQKLLLEAEGVEVWRTEEGWQTDMQRYGWKPSLEEAEALRCLFEETGI